MFKSKKSHFFLIIILPLLILSCWDSSPTSDKSRTYKIGGVVVDKNGAGISGVTVQISGTNFSSADTTDAEGTFAFENVKPDNYKLKAQKDSCIFKPSYATVTVEKSDIDTLNFTSVDNYLHGYVLDITNMKGIGGVTVILNKYVEYSTTFVDSTITDSNGEYSFYDLEPNRYSVWCGPVYETFRNYGRDYVIELSSFKNSEILAHNFYFSSEKLTFTKVEFSEETKTLYLEWSPSKSEHIVGYDVRATNLPDGFSKIESDFCFSFENKASVKVTSQNVMGLFDEDVISGEVYLSVRAAYNKDNDYFRSFSPGSEEIAVRISW